MPKLLILYHVDQFNCRRLTLPKAASQPVTELGTAFDGFESTGAGNFPSKAKCSEDVTAHISLNPKLPP